MTNTDIRRKVRNRLAALEYTPGFSEENISATAHATEHPSLGQRYLDEAWNNHDAAASCALQDGYLPLTGGRFKVFIKKAMRKLLKIFWGWYIFPIYARQSHFNGKTDNAVSALISSGLEQDKMIATVINENEQLKEQISDVVHQLHELQAASMMEIEEMKRIIDCLKKQNAEMEDDNSIVKAHLADIRSELEEYRSSAKNTEKTASVISREVSMLRDELGLAYDPALIDSDIVDYFDFEDHFRGLRESIIDRQRQYIPYLKTEYTNGYVLELGFGRGELLEMMRDSGIAAKGADIYPPFVKYCSELGFDVCQADALEYLTRCEDDSLNGIILSQVAEHLRPKYLYQLIRTGFRKLHRGCCFIIETPNPESLSTYLNFYIDGTHNNPVHYLTLEYFFKQNGYSETLRLSDDYSRHPYAGRFRRYVVDKCEDPEKKEILNDINEAMFSGRDYTIIARK